MILSDNAKKSFKVYDDDSFIVSYPRSGQTWFRSLLATVKCGKGWLTDIHVDSVIPDFRRTSRLDRKNLGKGMRIFKTHEYVNSRYKRILYLVRDPRAVAYSLWNWRCKMNPKSKWKYEGPFDIKFIEEFLAGKIFPGAWTTHIEGWSEHAKNHDVSFEWLFYEDLFRRTKKFLHTSCVFLGIPWKEYLLEDAVRQFPAGKPTGFLVNSIKPLTASPNKWREAYTEEMLNLINSELCDHLKELGYEV